MHKVAMVTGASRGIGRAAAVELARRGFDVAFTARTLQEGAGYIGPSSSQDGALRLPGSIETTTAQIEALGRRALGIQMDLRDRMSVERAAQQVLGEFGCVDVLVNNALDGEGSREALLQIDIEVLDRLLKANFLHQVLLTQRLLPSMLEAGSGIIINLTSAVVANADPSGGPGSAGLGYASSKAALDRMAGILHAELYGRGVRAHNLDPGLVMTEKMRARGMEQLFAGKVPWAEPHVPAAVIGWLATAPEAAQYAGTTIQAQPLCSELRLVDGYSWPPTSVAD